MSRTYDEGPVSAKPLAIGVQGRNASFAHATRQLGNMDPRHSVNCIAKKRRRFEIFCNGQLTPTFDTPFDYGDIGRRPFSCKGL